MARSPRPWFRFYVEAFHDPKLRRLPVAQRWLWAAVLGAARQSPVSGVLVVGDEPMTDADLADFAGIPVKDVRSGLANFERLKMIGRDPETNRWCVLQFHARQYESDSSTERTSQWRSRKRHGDADVTAVGTPPETETDNYPPNPPPPAGGNPRSVGTNPRAIGQRDDEHRRRQDAIDSARALGANLVAGGSTPDELEETFERKFPEDPECLAAARAGAAEVVRAS